MIEILSHHTLNYPDNPLFVYLSFETVHTPLQLPPKIFSQCDNVVNEMRQIYCNKILYLDEIIGKVKNLYEDYDLWDNTILLLSTDNGGLPNWYDDDSLHLFSEMTRSYGCNLPYRGGKLTLFEGGIKGIGLINGGNNYISSNLRNTQSNILIHVIDWLPTII